MKSPLPISLFSSRGMMVDMLILLPVAPQEPICEGWSSGLGLQIIDMNYLAIDFGTKNVGLAYSQSGIIATLPAIKNDDHLFQQIIRIISDYSIVKIYVGLSEGNIAIKTKKFIADLQEMVKLPIETVEEAVSTIEAAAIYQGNQNPRRRQEKKIDSVSAAVILNRVIS